MLYLQNGTAMDFRGKKICYEIQDITGLVLIPFEWSFPKWAPLPYQIIEKVGNAQCQKYFRLAIPTRTTKGDKLK